VNDPIYGFINISSDIIFDLVEHPYFQRLRRIKQLGLTNFVYPGANHTRFQHGLGSLHLMEIAINDIRSKGHEITPEESEAVIIAILLHDIGHGPFSHALEYAIIENFNHEQISFLMMKELNRQFDNRLSLAIKIFQNKYHKKFLHQLVSGQLDMDRLDYLNRDSFFTGVSEGVIGTDRIIKMLNVVDDQLVVEAKGIYSIEKFLIARRLMYWQVYLHKTVLSAENLLVNILKRAKKLASEGHELFATPALHYFLYNKIKMDDLNHTDSTREILNNFSKLDDNDIVVSTKVWADHKDKVLSKLCSHLTNRLLFKIEIQNKPFSESRINEIKATVNKRLRYTAEELAYFVFTGTISNNTYNYNSNDDRIKILYNNGILVDIAEASDMLNIAVLSKIVKKHFVCYPKELNI